MSSRHLMSIAKIVSYAFMVVAYGVMTWFSFRQYQNTGSMSGLGLVIVNALFVIMYVTRRDASSISQAPAAWIFAFLGTSLPLALRPTAPADFSDLGNAVQVIGLVCIIGSILSLRRSFGIVPANRGVRTSGLYQLVRHPLYSSELLFMGGFALANPSAWNISLWCADCLLQFARACAEERLLREDAAYASYMSRVRYRFVPRIV